MHPILVKIGFLRIYSYGVMMVIAFLAASYFLSREARARGMHSEAVFDLAFTSFVWAIIGARFFYVALHPAYYFQHPLDIIKLHRGGLVFFGGAIFGIIAGSMVIARKKLPWRQTLDLFSPYIALGHAIGRIGCFLNGCCYGKPTMFFLGVCFPGEPFKRHPTQLYEAAALLVIFFVLKAIRAAKRYRPLDVFLGYVVLYSLWRFCIEYIRGDTAVALFGLTLFQLMSLAFFAAGIVAIVFLHSRKQA